MNLKIFVIPQVPGTVPRSHAIYGCAEGFVKSKKYVLPAALLSPYLTAGMLAVYVVDGRFSLPKNAPPHAARPHANAPITASLTASMTTGSSSASDSKAAFRAPLTGPFTKQLLSAPTQPNGSDSSATEGTSRGRPSA